VFPPAPYSKQIGQRVSCQVVRRTSYYKTVTVGWWRLYQNGDLLTSQKHDASLVISWDWRALASALPLTQSTGKTARKAKRLKGYVMLHPPPPDPAHAPMSDNDPGGCISARVLASDESLQPSFLCFVRRVKVYRLRSHHILQSMRRILG
jgi:hypothetical protein